MDYISMPHMEADTTWYQPCRVYQNDEEVPMDAMAFIQPFHPGVLNLLHPYEETLKKQRRLKQRLHSAPLHGRFDSLTVSAGSSAPEVHGA